MKSRTRMLGAEREARALAGELVYVARKWNTPTEVGAALRLARALA